MRGESTSPVSPHYKIATQLLASVVLSEVSGCAVENVPRTTYRSKQELIDAGFYSPHSLDVYCKDDPETVVFSVLSGMVGS